ncbi:MAG: 4-phosphoerythronate dehydrogenase [Kangiellaceae bacterium]|jgi:erythronate-4-phosphate dehydrogenase|nr:4-phosphoerythronate dehydrogenase [Kangiellaceae bacterium]
MTETSSDKPTLVVDQAIPYIEELFSQVAEVVAVSAVDIDRDLVAEADADALAIRSVTKVDETLVTGAGLRWLGTATIGQDHIDHDLLDRNNIKFCSAPGSNALAVVQYVMSAISYWRQLNGRSIEQLTVAIVGYGEIGRRLYQLLSAIGINCLISDPPLCDQGKLSQSITLNELAQHCDVLTLHVPYTKSGPHATHHIINSSILEVLPSSSLLINSARGPLIDETALVKWLEKGGDAILDVWPSEPNISSILTKLILLGTPHIAGYSLEGKFNATMALYHSFVKEFYPLEYSRLTAAIRLPPNLSDKQSIVNPSGMTDFFLKSYSISQDAIVDRSKSLIDKAAKDYREFVRKRNNYSFRRDYSGQSVDLQSLSKSERSLIISLLNQQLFAQEDDD